MVNSNGASTGIKLHVDLGPDSPRDYSVYSLGMPYANYPAASKWGAKSRAALVTYVQTLGAFDGAGQYLWTRPTGATGRDRAGTPARLRQTG